MRTSIILLALIPCLVLGGCGRRNKKEETADKPQGSPKIEFEYKSVELGSFPKDSAATLELKFPFSNTGNGELLILETSTNCRCATVKYPRYGLKPGHKDTIVVILDTDKMVGGGFRKSAYIYSNCEPAMSGLYITGRIIE